MIMAAVLALTSLPAIAVSAAGAELSSMKKGDVATVETKSTDDWSSNVTALKESYAPFVTRDVHMWNISQWTSHLLEGISLTKDESYRIAINARKNADSAVNGFVLGLRDGTDTTRNKGKDWITGDPLGSDYTSTYFVNGTTLSGKISVTSEFADYYIPFTAPSTVDTAELHYYMPRYSSPAVIDISRFAVEKYDSASDTWSTVKEWVASVAYDVKWGSHIFSANGTYSYVYKEWMEASVDSATATYDIDDVKLLPGVYEFTGTFFTDAGSASVGVKVNDTAMTVGVTDATVTAVSDEETAVKFSLTVTEETTLSALTFDWSKDTSSEAAEIRFKNLGFACVELIGDSKATSNIQRGVTVARADSIAFWSADDVDADIVIDDSKNYAYCRLQGQGAGFKHIELYSTSLCELGKMYTIVVKVRQSELCTNPGKAMETVIYVDGTKYTSFYSNIPTSGEWCEFKYTFSFPDTVNSTATLAIFPNTRDWVEWDFRGIAMYETENPDNVVLAYGEYDKTVTPAFWKFPIRNSSNLKVYGNLTEFMLVPAAGGTDFTYDASAKEIWLDPGTYVVSGTFGATEGEQSVKLIATAENDSIAIGETVTVGTAKSPATVELAVESRTKLSSITVSVGDGAAVAIGNITIVAKREKFTAPNVGIMMALLLKKRGFVYTNIIADATTEEGLEIWDIPEGATLTINDDGKPYLSMSNITKSSDAFVYAPGITLAAGTYKLSCVMRTPVSGETTQNRIWFDGTRVASVKLTNAWTKFEFIITVNEDTEFELKFNGDAAIEFNKNYDIRDLAFIDLDEENRAKNAEVESEAGSEVETENTTETE